MKIDSSLRPFEKKSFFLDLNGFPQEASLIKNLKLLGARQEPVFSKYVSFVVSNRVPLKTTPAAWNQRPYSPITSKSNEMCPSPQLLSDCSPLDYLDSSVYADSPVTDQNPPSPKVLSRGMALLKKAAFNSPTTSQDPPSPKVLSRGMALLKKAAQKVKENQRATDLLEHCKRWGIKVYHVDKVLSIVKKYTNLIAAQYAKKKDQKKKNGKKKDDCSNAKKLLPPFIKFEDSNRKFRPVFQEFTAWTDVIDSSLSHNINQLNKHFKRTGDLSDIARSVFAEVNLNVDSDMSRINSPHATGSRTKSYTKLTETLKPSNPTSVQVSTVIHPMDREKENSMQQVKNKQYHKRFRTLYCEICHKNYVNLDEHMNTEKHKKFMSNPMNFLVVQDIVTSLPKKGDDLLYKSYLDLESNNMGFSGSFFGGQGNLPHDNSMYQPDIIDTAYDPVFNFNDLPTEPYSFLDPEVVSPSCSSPDVGTLPFLEDSLEKFPIKSLLHGGENENNAIDFSKENKSDFKQENSMDCNKIIHAPNTCLNITESCINNDIIDVVNTLVESIKYEEEPVVGNKISVSDATENAFAENFPDGESCINVQPQLSAQPVVVHLSHCYENNLPEETLNKAPEKENRGHDSELKDETNDNMNLLLEVQQDNSETQVAFDSVGVNIRGKRKKRKPSGNANFGSKLKQKRRKVTSKSRNFTIKKTETEVISSVQSFNLTDYNSSSVQNNLFTQSLLYAQAESLISEETCDSQDSAIVVGSSDIYFPCSKNAENISKSTSKVLEICSEIMHTFENVNPNDSTVKRVGIESNTESLFHSQMEIISGGSSDSQDSAIFVPLNDIDSTVTTLQNSTDNIPELPSEVFQICSETALAFEMVNPKDCKRRSIESNTSDSDYMNYNMCHEMFQNSPADSSIDTVPSSFLHSVLNSSFEKSCETEADPSVNLDKNCSPVVFENSCTSPNCYGSSIDLSEQSYSNEKEIEPSISLEAEFSVNLDKNCSSVVSANSCNSPNCYVSSIDLSEHSCSNEKETESVVNLDENCSLDISVNNCISANCFSSGIDSSYESMDTSVHFEDEPSYLCQTDIDTSINYIHQDTSNPEEHSMPDSQSKTTAAQTNICHQHDKKTVSEPVCDSNSSSDISFMPVISICSKHDYVDNIHSKHNMLDNDLVKYEENKECLLEILHHDFDSKATEDNNLVYDYSSCGDQSLIVQKDIVEKKNKSTKCSVRKQIESTFISTFLAENKHFSYIYGNKLQLLHISGIEFHECLFICSLGHCLAGSGEISVAETLKLQECLISVDSTIKISPLKQNPACHSLDKLKKSYSSKEKWNLLLVKMEDLKLESGFIGQILEKCQGKAFITLSGAGNKRSVNKNCTTSPKPNSPVFMTILFSYQDATIHDKFGNKNICNNSLTSNPLNYSSSQSICDIGVKNLISSNDEIVGNSTNNSLVDACCKSLVTNQPLNLCTKESEQVDTNTLEASTTIPQLNHLMDPHGNLAPYSPFEILSDDCSYERIAKQLYLSSPNLQYIEPISVCGSDCEVNCCRPCTCDLGGGKCLPATCYKFHYVDTSSVDSSDNVWTSHELAIKKTDLECLKKPILELCNITPEFHYGVPTNYSIGSTCLPQTFDHSQSIETKFMESTYNELSLCNSQATPTLNVSKDLINPVLDSNEGIQEISNYEHSSDIYIVIDDADYETDEEWDNIKSDVDNVCREFCDNKEL